MNKQRQNHLKLVAEATQPYIDLLDTGIMLKINEEANVGYRYMKLKSGYTCYWLYHDRKFSLGRQSLKQLRLKLYKHIQDSHKITYQSNADILPAMNDGGS